MEVLACPRVAFLAPDAATANGVAPNLAGAGILLRKLYDLRWRGQLPATGSSADVRLTQALG